MSTFTFSDQGNFVACKFVCGFAFAREARVIIRSGNWVQAQSKEVSKSDFLGVGICCFVEHYN